MWLEGVLLWLAKFWSHWYGKLSAAVVAVSTLGKLVIWIMDFINKRKQGRMLDLQLKDARREAAVKEMIRKIEALKEQERQKHPGKHIASQILAGPDDDPEIFAEAMRRLRKERKNSSEAPSPFKLPWS